MIRKAAIGEIGDEKGGGWNEQRGIAEMGDVNHGEVPR
jgi:hypothetical protein